MYLIYLFVLIGIASSQLNPYPTSQRGQTLVSRLKGGQWADREGLVGFTTMGETKKMKAYGNYTYVLNENAVTKIDARLNLGDPTSFERVIPDALAGRAFIDFVVVPELEYLYTVGTSPSLSLLKWGTNPLGILAIPQNPFALTGGLDAVHTVLVDRNYYVYVVTGQTRIARIKDVAQPMEVAATANQNDMPVTTCAWLDPTDPTQKLLYLCGESNIVYQVDIDKAKFSDVSLPGSFIPRTIDNIGNDVVWRLIPDPYVPPSGEKILYVVTRGLKPIESPALVIKISRGVDGKQWNEVKRTKLSDYDFEISGVTTDGNGMMYLSTLPLPPRVIQVSLPDMTWETSYELNNTYTKNPAIAYNPGSGDVFVGTSNLLNAPVVLRGKAAASCEGNCYGRGTCTYRVCTCTGGYGTPWCEGLSCAPGTNNQECSGKDNAVACNNGTCLCKPRFTGNICQTPQCPNNCSFKLGNAIRCTTNPTTNLPDKCVCAEGWNGDDCSLKTSLPCYRYTKCSECLASLTCGWCANLPPAKACINGGIEGPLNGTCLNWNYQTCPEIVSQIINGVIIAVTLLLFLINAITMVLEDSKEANEIETRDEWYYYQRSSKAYWAAYQVQYLGVVVLLVPHLPTSLLNWVYTCVWSLGVGFEAPPNNAPTAITKRSVDQFLTLDATTPRMLAGGAVILCVAVWFIAFIFYAIALMIGTSIKGGSERRFLLLKTRALYIFIRCVDLFYFGIIALSCAQLSISKRAGDGATGAIVSAISYLILFGLVIPGIFYGAVLKTPLNELIKKDVYKYIYMSFYGIMKPRCRKWLILPWVKRLLIAVAFGAFANVSVVAQVVIAVFVEIVYIIAIFLLDPYADYLHYYMDLFTSGLTALSFLPLFGFVSRDLPRDGVIGVTAVFLIFQILSFVVCVGMFVYSWMQLKGVYSFAQMKNCCS